VAEIRELYSHLPLLANLRGGLWLAPSFDDTCYFKSTDGHYGEWHLSLKRLNLHVARLASSRNGVLVVDATRRKGKTLPDSLAKTLPIWAACLNRAVRVAPRSTAAGTATPSLTVPASTADQGADAAAAWGSGTSSDGSGQTGEGAPCAPRPDPELADTVAFHAPRERVDEAEKAQISEVLDTMVGRLLDSAADITEVAGALRVKPLRPLWITVKSRIFTDMVPDYRDAPFAPLICVGASDPAINGAVLPVFSGKGFAQGHTFVYCQGASDDEECWSRGLTPELFWAHTERILGAAPHRVAFVVDTIVKQGLEHTDLETDGVHQPHDGSTAGRRPDPELDFCNEIGSTGIFVGGRRAGRPPQCWDRFGAVVNVTMEEYSQAGRPDSAAYLQLPVAEGKRDRHRLDALLPSALRFVYAQIRLGRKVLIHCAQGRDRSVGVAVAVLAALFDPSTRQFVPSDELDSAARSKDDWQMRLQALERVTTKRHLDDTLQWLMRHHPRAQPSRLTLKKVQRFFLEDGPDAIAPRDLLPPATAAAIGGCQPAAEVPSRAGENDGANLVHGHVVAVAPSARASAGDGSDGSGAEHRPSIGLEAQAPDGRSGAARDDGAEDAHAAPAAESRMSDSSDPGCAAPSAVPLPRDHFAGLAKMEKGRNAYWLVGEIGAGGGASAGVAGGTSHFPLIVGLQVDKNPDYNCIKLIALSAGRKIAYMLLEHPPTPEATSCLRGMLVNNDYRGHGVSTLLVATWLRLCLNAGMTPSTNRIDKPLIALVLQKFGFVPAQGSVSVIVGSSGEDGKLVVWSSVGLSGTFSHRDLRTHNMVIADKQPAGGVTVAVQTSFTMEVSIDELTARIDRLLRNRLTFAAGPEPLRRALLVARDCALHASTSKEDPHPMSE
jgi:tRNA A64-2'-O-ribosylphosphate transferase